MSPRTQEALSLRYGPDGKVCRTLAEIARVMGICPARARQLIRGAERELSELDQITVRRKYPVVIR